MEAEGRMLLHVHWQCGMHTCFHVPDHTTWSTGFCCVEPYSQSCHCPWGWERLRLAQKSLMVLSQLRKTSQDIWEGITMSLKAQGMPHESAIRGTALNVHGDFLHHVYWPKISSKPLNNGKGRHSILMMSFMMKTISVVCLEKRKSLFCYTYYALPSWGSGGALLGTGVQPATTALHHFPQQFMRSWSMTEWHFLHSSLLWIFPRDYHIPLKAECHWTASLECVHVPHNWQVGMSQRVWGFVDPCFELSAFLSQQTDWHGHSAVETHLDSCDYHYPNRVLYPETGRLPGEHDTISRCFWCVPQTTEVSQDWPGVMTTTQTEPQNEILPTHITATQETDADLWEIRWQGAIW